ncbi:FtsB family cell division protein [Alkalicoccus daliensis]|uniref:Cell division protein DivIC n=1 Tax=Alkalicoccus daliensis TaxID=745820 RepID=A0A1H0KVE8_9BACI|nr:septum formation initiator family protein [Alkalicoccus daliensis]SDO59835.1 cell division protein DivIC [Alkalicoccus daliensis]
MEEGRKTQIRRLTTEYMERQEQQEEHRQRRLKGLKRRLSVFGAGVLLFFLIASVTLFQQHATIQESEQENQQLEQRLAEMETEGKELEAEIEALHDEEYIAELARRDFFMSKPGETLFQLPRSQVVEE